MESRSAFETFEVIDGCYLIVGESHDMHTVPSRGALSSPGLAIATATNVAFVLTDEEHTQVELFAEVEEAPPVWLEPGDQWNQVAQAVIKTDSPLWVRTLEQAPVAQLTEAGGTFRLRLHERLIDANLLERGEVPLKHYLQVWPVAAAQDAGASEDVVVDNEEWQDDDDIVVVISSDEHGGKVASMDEAFVESCAIMLELVGTPEVESRWHEESVLARMSVGMLACHVARQVGWARELLPVFTTLQPLGEAAEHYRRAAWVTADSLDDPANDRGRDESEAQLGFEKMVTTSRAALVGVERMLSADRAESVVAIPWQGWSLGRDDFLLTRLVEIVVHTDDLARSVDLPTPEFPLAAYQPVLHLLADLAAQKHGQAALTSALTRDERQPRTISAF